MKRPTMLLAALLADASLLCGVSTTKDVETIRHRISKEGYSFCTMTLPILSDFLERGIEEGRLGVELGFSFKFQRNRRLPRFMGGFFARVFDDNGYLLKAPDPDAILAIRQISRSFKKIFEVCDPARSKAAAFRYLSIEEELKTHVDTTTKPDPVLDRTSILLGRWFVERFLEKAHEARISEIPSPKEDGPANTASWEADNELSSGFTFSGGSRLRHQHGSSFQNRWRQPPTLEVRHGPGATGDRRTANSRLTIREWPLRAMDLFPLADYGIPNWGCQSDLGLVQELDGTMERPVRVVFVPKTALTPRVIAVEPSVMQYLQQGVMHWMVHDLERGPLTKGHINFSDQTVNQQLAYSNSITKLSATVDLKDASDRVHFKLAERILRYTPYWPYLEVTRSRCATLPDGTTLELSKFASMGSATCFPVEAYVFYALVISAIHVHQKQVPTERSMRTFSRGVYVYGDDIVVPTPYVDFVCEYLEGFGLRVNRNKTFSRSHFRESCGADFYFGHAVKPVYFRQHLPSPRERWTPKQRLAWVAASNQLYMAGWWQSSQVIRDWLENEVGNIPRVPTKVAYALGSLDSSVLASDNPNGLAFASVVFATNLRWHENHQGFGWRILDYKLRNQEDPVETYSAALYKGLKNIGQDHAVDFCSSKKRDGFTLKRRWVGFYPDMLD